MRSVGLLRAHRNRWSPYVLGQRLKMWARARDTSLISLSGASVNSWTDQIGGIAYTNTLTARPDYVATGINGYPGILFGSEKRLNNTATFGSVLPVGTSASTVVVLGVSYNLSALRARMFSYGSTSAGRSIYVIDSEHNIGLAGSGSAGGAYQETASQISGPFVAIGDWSDGFQTIYWNGNQGGGSAVTFNTVPTRASIGGTNGADPGGDFFDGMIGEVLVIQGTLTADEKNLITKSLLDDYDLSFDVLKDSTNPYRPLQPSAYEFQSNVEILNTQMTNAIGQPTLNTSPPMSDPPTVTYQDASGLPPGFSLRGSYSATPGILRTSGGWDFTTGSRFHRSPSGYLGLIAGVNFLVNVTQRMEVVVDDGKVAVNILDSTQNYRASFDGQVIDRNGQSTTSETSWMIFDFTGHGGSASRKLIVESESSNAIAGIALTSAGRASLTPLTTTPSTLLVLGDSFTAATGATRNWFGYAPQLSDNLGFTRYIPDGVVGSGWLSTSNATLANALSRVDDVTDRSTYRRNSLGATGLSHPRCVMIALGINDEGYSTAQVETQANRVLDQIRQVLPGVPILVLGPWNPRAPLSYSASSVLVDNGIVAACAGRPGVAYIDIQYMTYAQVGDSNIHPNDLGHAQIAAYLPDPIRAAIASFL